MVQEEQEKLKMEVKEEDSSGVKKKKVLGGSKNGSLAFNDELEVDSPHDVDCFAACGEGQAPVPIKISRRSSAMNRRRSSLGALRRTSLTEPEQARIVEMYKQVIQMSSENVNLDV